ncbi:MAG: hypothetical protein AB1725_04060 [Armatimonadota bacterium]
MILFVNPDDDSFEKVDSCTYQEIGVWEPRQIQDWIRQFPELLGEELLIVADQFAGFSTSSDRLDLLALDREGNLVVIELKRDASANYADLQAIRYAAMVSSMTLDTLVQHYIAFTRKFNGEPIDEDEARTRIVDFVRSDELEELSSAPRVILCSLDFSREVTTTALWLSSFGIDITCVRITPYSHDGHMVVVPTRVIPIPNAEEYMIQIERKDRARRDTSQKRRPDSLKVLLDNNLVHADQPIFLRRSLPHYVELERQRSEDSRFKAVITGNANRNKGIRWEHDGKEYSITGLTEILFKQFHPERKNPGGINGNTYWETEDGRSLWEIAEEVREVRPGDG